MKPTSFDEKKPFSAKHRFRRQQGFALIVSLSLMVLITVLAVGLLTLSSVSMRASAHTEAMQTAKGNARLALMLALGQLQKAAGPDQRISAPANLVSATNPQGVAGVWKSWRPPSDGSGDYKSEKKNHFAGYMTSAPSFPSNVDPSEMPGSASPMETMVGEGSLGSGSTDRQVKAPIVSVGQKGTPDAGSIAWVALDEGVKGRIDLLPDKDTSTTGLGKNIMRVGSSPRNKAGKNKGLENLNGEAATLNETLPKLVSVDEVNLMSSDKETFGRYFHDFSVTSNSVQADVANGGLKTDLSVLFDNATLPTDYASKRVYSSTTAPFGGSTAADPLWGIYQHYYRLYQRTTANDNPKDGLKSYVSSRYRLATVSDRTLRDNRYEPNMATLTESVIMPTIAKVDIVFSMMTRDVHGGRADGLRAAGYPKMLHLMYLPVITLHNPYNVPLRFTQLELEFEDLPMGFQFFVGGQPATSNIQAFNQLYVNKENGSTKKIFKLLLTGDLTANREVVMGAGETRIFGKPFPPDWTWANESAGTGADGTMMFDWRNDKTQMGNRIMPGMITGPNDGIGYDVDWLAATNRQPWLTARTGEGIIPLKDGEQVSVKYAPKAQASTPTNKFSVTMRLTPGNTTNNYSTTQVFFKDEARLKAILEEGTSPRFPLPRTFPETYPRTGDLPQTSLSLYEPNTQPIKKYTHARPFAIFSLSGKTTRDSFTKSRPVADTGLTFQMATCDFTTSASQGSSPLEFVLTPFPSSLGFQTDGVKGYFFGGHDTNNGSTSASIYEIPQAPWQSIAQMRHANAASLGAAPYFTYSVGESRAHPAIPVASVKFAPDTSRIMLDHSWLANDALWDRYWFSTLATLQGTAFTGSDAQTQTALSSAFFNGEKNLPNPRNQPYLTAGTAAKDAATDAIAERNGARTAAYIMTKGGFNVNSVSKAAWISVLSALSDSSIPLASGALEKTADDVPMLRMRRPVGGLKEGREIKNQLWNSYRKLSTAEIDALAEQIVIEVRERGPFLSMSDFVNRRLASGDLGQKGALQAAIDHARFNQIMEANATVIGANDVANYGWKNAAAVIGTNTGAGAPGEISQGDLLSAIGSFTTVRSDTFRIRAFGDARDKDGQVLARAWCEATVQRFPEYVDQTDKPELVATTQANKSFGRRFSVVAFRWLHPDEV
ncbi:pilus assembly PilX family protein [Luteolibacter soli]|uniref:Verru_Chthon cassette protein A n=1 Tax=Luteolibacter soli TaxID=3135280 RepID=A0ABU9B1V4_9BACT